MFYFKYIELHQQEQLLSATAFSHSYELCTIMKMHFAQNIHKISP